MTRRLNLSGIEPFEVTGVEVLAYDADGDWAATNAKSAARLADLGIEPIAVYLPFDDDDGGDGELGQWVPRWAVVALGLTRHWDRLEGMRAPFGKRERCAHHLSVARLFAVLRAEPEKRDALDTARRIGGDAAYIKLAAELAR